MANNTKTKLKTLYVMRVLQEETDATHGLTMRQIIERLEQYGIAAERKSVYRDINLLQEFGFDIRTFQRTTLEYALVTRQFSLQDLMLIVDAVQSCKSLTSRQCDALVDNIKLLASAYDRDLLDRRIHVLGRIRSKNDSVFYNIDTIHDALRANRKVAFDYYRRNASGERYLTHSHVVSPLGVEYEEGYYYLTAWNDERDAISEFRLDRMDHVEVSAVDATRNDVTTNYRYTENQYVSFGHFTGEELSATLKVDPNNTEIILDRFGEDVTFYPTQEGSVLVNVHIKKSQQFYGWVAGLNNAVTIAGPASLVDDYHAYLKHLLNKDSHVPYSC